MWEREWKVNFYFLDLPGMEVRRQDLKNGRCSA